MKALIISLFIGLLTVSPVIVSAQEVEHEPQLLALVGLIDQIPSGDQLLAAGCGEDGAALRAIANDAALVQYVRLRAVHMLAHFPNPTNAVFTREISLNRDQNTEMRVTSLFVFSNLTEAVEAEEIDALIAQLLRDEDPELQIASIRAAGRLAPDRGEVLLRGFVQTTSEVEPRVVRELERTMADF